MRVEGHHDQSLGGEDHGGRPLEHETERGPVAVAVADRSWACDVEWADDPGPFLLVVRVDRLTRSDVEVVVIAPEVLAALCREDGQPLGQIVVRAVVDHVRPTLAPRCPQRLGRSEVDPVVRRDDRQPEPFDRNAGEDVGIALEVLDRSKSFRPDGE